MRMTVDEARHHHSSIQSDHLGPPTFEGPDLPIRANRLDEAGLHGQRLSHRFARNS